MRDNVLPHANCYMVAPRLIAGEYPGAAELAEARARVARHTWPPPWPTPPWTSRSIDAFAAQLAAAPRATAVLFFAGHGVQHRGSYYRSAAGAPSL